MIKLRIRLLMIMAVLCTPAFSAENVSQASEVANRHSTSPIMVFVSFSMPHQSLIAYLQDANKIHASIIVRGLVNNSLKETVNTISLLVKEAGGGGIEINPFAFTTFHITKVPSVVVTSTGNPCIQQSSCRIEKDYDVIAGNITLQAALEVVDHHGQVAVIEANNALTMLRGGEHV